MRIKKESKKAQVTIFIIIGILLVGAIALFFLLEGDVLSDITGGSEEINPNSFMTSCIEDELIEAMKLISAQGGYITNPLNITFKFDDDDQYWDISYLCYNQNYYYPCINQEPMLVQHLKDEIHDYIADNVEQCFGDLNSSLESQGFVLSNVAYRDFEVELAPKKVMLDIDASITATKTEETKNIDGIKAYTQTKFYDLAVVVQEIVSQEAIYCNFENLGYSLIYNDFKIDKFKTSDSTKIYTVNHKGTKERFRFAIKSCVIPAGIR